MSKLRKKEIARLDRELADLRASQTEEWGRIRDNPERWNRSEVQTLLFPRDRFTVKSAWAWAREHGFKQSSPDVTDEYIRLRQRDPDEFGEMRTIAFGESGIKAVVGEPQ